MKFFALSLFALTAVSFAQAQDPDPQSAARTLVENEGKFYEMGQEQGTRAAFLAFLADDGIVFSPAPTNGKAVWSKRPEKGISLQWKPLFAGIARSADLGYTTGPAEWRKNKEDEKPFGYGQFVSIWKTQKDGSWKVALDVGSELPGPSKREEEPPVAFWISEAPLAAKSEGSAPLKKLREAESKFATAAKADSTIALSEAASADIRVHREGVFPAVGKEPARLMLSVRRGKLTHERMGGGVSDAGDLGYSYGKYTLVESQQTERGYYLQIWRLEGDAWKLALDYESPLPSEEKKK